MGFLVGVNSTQLVTIQRNNGLHIRVRVFADLENNIRDGLVFFLSGSKG